MAKNRTLENLPGTEGAGGGGGNVSDDRKARGGMGVGNALIFESWFHRVLNILHMGDKTMKDFAA